MSNEDTHNKPETENAANAGTNAAESAAEKAARLGYNEKLTEIVFILDRSGSMGGREKSTIEGFNTAIAEQRDAAGTALVSTVLFDYERIVLHDRVDLREIRPMTEKEYWTRGMTALLDAVGHAIKHIANVHKYARKEDVPAKTLVFIITDGWENASCDFTRADIAKMIKEREEKHGWSFIYLGANIDAFNEAGSFGLRREQAFDMMNDDIGNRKAYREIGRLCRAARERSERVSLGDIAEMRVFRDNIDADFLRRSGRMTSRHAGAGYETFVRNLRRSGQMTSRHADAGTSTTPNAAGTPKKSRKPRNAKSAGTNSAAGTPPPDANL